MLANLKHPNLPSIYDYFGEHGRWYLVMDFIEGTTLDARLDKAAGYALTVTESIEIGIQLAKVLGYLHTRATPIIFRDLKPLNIMITPEDNIYLIDFGIARLFKPGKAKDTVAYVSAGYAAPEQFGRAQTSPQSDMYSLGATLHQLLSGNEPRSNMPLFTFKPLQSYNPNILTALAELVAKMVNTDPALRPVSMVAIRQELERIQMQVKQPSTPIPPAQYAPQTHYAPPPPHYSYTPSPHYAPSPFAAQQVQAQHPIPFQLPNHRLRNTILIGIIAGVLWLVSLVLLVFSPFTGLIICPVAGFISGKTAILRRMGLIAGFIAGVIYNIPLLIVAIATQGPYAVFVLFLLGLVCSGPLGLLGAWLATRKHSYYKKP
ncbi:MAG: hypothetical protein NVS4B11_29960 [Ktedonobacteraceae bacterium]